MSEDVPSLGPQDSQYPGPFGRLALREGSRWVPWGEARMEPTWAGRVYEVAGIRMVKNRQLASGFDEIEELQRTRTAVTVIQETKDGIDRRISATGTTQYRNALRLACSGGGPPAVVLIHDDASGDLLREEQNLEQSPAEEQVGLVSERN